MSRNWYAVYTKPHKERKVIAVLNKKKIENFCPWVSVKEGRGEYARQSQQPLFESLVFVHLAEEEIKSVFSITGVSTIAYWKSRPAVISDSEIDIVRKVTDTYADVKLEKTFVEVGKQATVVDGPSMDFSEKTVLVKYKSVKANLPSLGFMITATGSRKQSRETYQQQGLFTSFPKRINAFFFN